MHGLFKLGDAAPRNNPSGHLAVIAAALLVVAGCAGSIGGGSTAAPTPTASQATASGEPSRRPYCSPGYLPSACRYGMTPIVDGATIMTGVEFPAGWKALGGGDGAIGPQGRIRFAVFGAGGLFSDPCHWDVDGSGVYFQPGDVRVGPTAADLADALHAHTAYTSSSPSAVTIGKAEGYALDIEFDPEIDPGECDQGRYTVFAGAEAGPMVTTGDTRWHLVVIQYGPDYRVIARLGYFTDTPEADVAAGKAIIESLTIGHLPLD